MNYSERREREGLTPFRFQMGRSFWSHHLFELRGRTWVRSYLERLLSGKIKLSFFESARR
ncbi:hypothetical protein Krac_3980 [Ktedonobacter racemifer DSM 44963]|uniref:Uncharacterized protein n=1 Tax=Ktedonobacter racemifer DSM 44963 TaxID=485913 RepID=D6U445_KTERA|nr:hypothetical protein Krac_3980 [Ktedonobacter racemifer DSM 44963]